MAARCRLRRILVGAAAFLCVVPAVVSTQAPRQRERIRTLTEENLPTFFVVNQFFNIALHMRDAGEEQLQRYLAQYGIPTPSRVRDVLLDEAGLAIELMEESRRNARSNRLPPGVTFHDDQRRVAEETGRCFGRFLRSVQDGGRYPDAFESIVRSKIGSGMSLFFDDDPDAAVYIYSLEAAFRSGIRAELPEY